MTNLESLCQALASRLKRGPDGEPVIEGRRGNIHEDGQGFSLYAGFGSARGLNRCKAALSFAQIRQEGDTEGVWHLASMPTKEQARAIRYWLGLSKRRSGSPEQAARLKGFRFQRRPEHQKAANSTISSASDRR